MGDETSSFTSAASLRNHSLNEDTALLSRRATISVEKYHSGLNRDRTFLTGMFGNGRGQIPLVSTWGSFTRMEEARDDEEEETFVYNGSRSKNGLPHGRGTMTFTCTGARFEGRFVKGEKTGRGCFYFPDGSSLLGSYVSDTLEGTALYNYPDGRTMVADYCNGELSGDFIEYDKNGNIVVRGHHQDDRRIGYVQIFDRFGAVLWGTVDKEGSLSGPGIAYIYPDMKHVLFGDFVDGVLKKANWGVLNCSIESEIPDISLDSKNLEFLYYDESSDDCISNFPLVVDKYEQDKVYVSKSRIAGAGEGLFAKKCLSENVIVSFYNGVRLTHDEVDSRDWSLNGCTIALDDEVVLDVPKEYAKLENYCATLGHKANHSSTPNCEYVFYDHPRFGEIKAIKTICNVLKDGELTCDYAYYHKHVGTGEYDVPSWFSNNY